MTRIVFARTIDRAFFNAFDDEPEITTLTSSFVEASSGNAAIRLTGSFDIAGEDVTGGVLTGIVLIGGGQPLLSITDFELRIDGTLLEDDSLGALDELDNLLDGDDVFLGSDMRDLFTGLTGDDRINGRGGKDRLDGGAGNDMIKGAGGSDRLTGDLGNDRLLGGAGGDRLDGGAGRDQVFGGGGRDLVDGGADNDRLSGGGGADQFVLNEGGGRDLVVDFSAEDGDSLRLDRGLWDERLRADAVIEAYADVTARGDTVLRFDDGERILLRGFDDLDYLADTLSLFG